MKRFNPLALSEFARFYGFHYDRIDAAGLVDDALAEMDRGLRGQDSSLPMIPAYISPARGTTPGKTVIALDAGGTNLRAARVTFDENGAAQAASLRKVPMPGTNGALGADAFFDGIAALAAPLIEAGGRVEGIGFCFSYPMRITEDADGILTAFSKEVDAPQVVGRRIGAGLREALARRNVRPPEKIVLLNDTAAALLAGLPACGAMAAPLVGCILGTGFNTAYPETYIPKIGFDCPAAPQIVVCESGSFAHGFMGALDREHDCATKNPGTYALEKASAGAYLGSLNFHITKQALRDGIFSFDRQDEFMALPALHTKDLNAFLREPSAQTSLLGELFADHEQDARQSFEYIASIITQRAALLCAAMVAATAEKAAECGRAQGLCASSPVRIAVEGTTYMAYKGMRSALESYLHVMLNRHRPQAYIITPAEQASLLGAAAAVAGTRSNTETAAAPSPLRARGAGF
ncbi:MAG: hexokinase [Treponema sp.]|nr:hexokinase [Treponema sp.]